MAILIAMIFSIDLALYEFWGFRLDSTLFFYLKSPKDAFASVPFGLFLQQFMLFLGYFALTYGWLRFILRYFPKGSNEPSGDTWRSKAKQFVILLLAGGLLFIPIRGGVTTSTANVGMVYFSQDQFPESCRHQPLFQLDQLPQQAARLRFPVRFLPRGGACGPLRTADGTHKIQRKRGGEWPESVTITHKSPPYPADFIRKFLCQRHRGLRWRAGHHPQPESAEPRRYLLYQPLCQLIPYG